MREIKFKAKVVAPEDWEFPPDEESKSWDAFAGGEWVEGYVTGVAGEQSSFCTMDGFHCYVWSDTICQYIGQTDKHTKEVYEGDLLKDDGDSIGEVIWEEDSSSFCINYPDIEVQAIDFESIGSLEVVGNIHDKD